MRALDFQGTDEGPVAAPAEQPVVICERWFFGVAVEPALQTVRWTRPSSLARLNPDGRAGSATEKKLQSGGLPDCRWSCRQGPMAESAVERAGGEAILHLDVAQLRFNL